jgi:hypothetical protein
VKPSTKYSERLTLHLRARLAWAAFPRCAAAVLGVVTLTLTLAPMSALAVWAVSWLTFYLVVRRMPGLPNRPNWKWLGPGVQAISVWQARWAFLAVGIAASLRHGTLTALAVVVGWLLIDTWYLLSPHQGKCELETWPSSCW